MSKYRKKFSVRINLDDLLLDVNTFKLFVEYIKFYINEYNIKINIQFIYKHKDTLKLFEKHKNNLSDISYKLYNYELDTFVWFNIIRKEESKHKSYKFASFYDDNNILLSIVEFFSFLKAALNRGSNGNSRNNNK